MTAINFPPSPSDGDTVVANGVTYTYNSTETKWKTTINSNAFLPLSGGTVTGNILMGGEIQHDGDTDTKLHFDTDTIKFDTAGSERFRVGSAGQLGIGGATYGTDGQVLTSTGATTAPAWETLPAGLSYTTSVVDVSGSIGTTFTSIPNDVRQLRVSFHNLSTATTQRFKLQLGDSDGLKGSGYTHTWAYTGSGRSGGAYTNDSGFSSGGWNNHANIYIGGYFLITRLDAQTETSNVMYLMQAGFGLYNSGYTQFSFGHKELSSQITQVSLRTDDGTNNFDSGVARIDYLS